MKEKKGFTIVELLMVLFIISLLGLILIGSFGKTQYQTEEEQSKVGNTVLYDAIEIYYYLSMKNDTLNYFYDASNNVVSCISLNTLISNGYLDAEKYNASQYAVITVKNGVMSYVITSNTSACNYEEVSISGVYDGKSSSSSGNSDVDDYSFNQTVSMVDVNTFNVDIDFTFKTFMQTIISQTTYVIMSLDTSGSMGGNIANANTAVTTLARDFANSEHNVCLAFINMNSSVTLAQPFTHLAFTANTVAQNAENYTHSLWMAYDMFYTPPSGLPKNYSTGGYPDDHASGSTVTSSSLGTTIHSTSQCANRLTANNKILLFMSDGVPVSAWNRNTMYDAASKLKNAGTKIITYRYGNYASASILETIASQNCTMNGKANQPCMYTTGAHNFIELLKQFVIDTINSIKETQYKTGKIELTLNTDYFTYSSAGNSNVSNKNNVVTVNLNLANYDKNTGNFIGDYEFNINYTGKSYTGSSKVLEVDIFKEVKITFYDSAGKASAPIQITNLPKINLSKYNASAVN